MVRFSDLLGPGDEGRAEGEGDRTGAVAGSARNGDEPVAADDVAAPVPTPTPEPNEPAPAPPTEPPPPPPPSGGAEAGGDLLERLTAYATKTRAPEPAPPREPARFGLPAESNGDAPAEEHPPGERWVDALAPVDDDLLPRDKKRR
jgi:hypothetical protein